MRRNLEDARTRRHVPGAVLTLTLTLTLIARTRRHVPGAIIVALTLAVVENARAVAAQIPGASDADATTQAIVEVAGVLVAMDPNKADKVLDVICKGESAMLTGWAGLEGATELLCVIAQHLKSVG